MSFSKEVKETIETGLGNYYGEVEAVEFQNKHYLTLSCHNTTRVVEISVELWQAFQKEFPTPKTHGHVFHEWKDGECVNPRIVSEKELIALRASQRE